MSSNIRVSEDGSAVMSEDLLKLVSGAFEVSIIQQLNLSHLGIKMVQNMEKCEMLKSLDLSHNQLATFGTSGGSGGALAAAAGNNSAQQTNSSKLPATTTILTSSNIGPKISPFPLANISLTLEYLDLSFNKLETISTLSHFRKLKFLKLHGNLLESLESDVISPLQGLRTTLNVLTLQMWRYGDDSDGNGKKSEGQSSGVVVAATNPLCSTTQRKEYLKTINATFPNLRCLDGHYFNKDLEDPFCRANAMDDSLANFQIPPHRPWVSEQQFKAAVASISVVESDPSRFEQMMNNGAAEKMFKGSLSDAAKALEAAKKEYGI